MYEELKLREELRQLKEEIKKGNSNQSIINRIYEIELLLANVYYY